MPTASINEQWDAYLSPNSTNLNDEYVIGPLVQTKWNQNGGYERFCPSLCPAGCTAVAMAQILKYWSCRINPNGGVSYEGIGYIGADATFQSTYYDWKNMGLTSPDNDNALIIFHAGASCFTHYNTNGSSSTPGRARDGFVNFWGISSSADVRWRIWHLRTWEDMLKNELNLGRPLLYSGGSISDGGHSWVVDGYRSDGAFHCNWGWGGLYDGPYHIAHFNVNSSSFNQIESAIFNVAPIQETGVATPQLNAQSFLYSANGYTIAIPDAFGATSYEWSCTDGNIQGTGTNATLYSDQTTNVSVRAYNSRCGIFSNYDTKQITINYPIDGPSDVCNSNSTFTLNGRPSGTTVNWLHSNNLVYVSGQGTDYYTVKAANSSSNGLGWVKAIVCSPCSDTLKKDIWVGKPAVPGIMSPYVQVEPNTLVTVDAAAPGADSFNWTISYGGTIMSGQGTNSISVLTSTYCFDYLSISVTASNTCGSESATKLIPYNCNGGGLPIEPLTISPNPASQSISVEFVDTTSVTTTQPADESYMVTLTNVQNKTVYHQKQNSRKFRINVRGYRRGVYYLKGVKGKNVYTKMVVISK
ncbi:MAG: C10 family peptidase [Bacteroidales bacterium]|nr:C10 family peptidase [Bacteroidales bacterium]